MKNKRKKRETSNAKNRKKETKIKERKNERKTLTQQPHLPLQHLSHCWLFPKNKTLSNKDQPTLEAATRLGGTGCKAPCTRELYKRKLNTTMPLLKVSGTFLQIFTVYTLYTAL